MWGWQNRWTGMYIEPLVYGINYWLYFLKKKMSTVKIILKWHNEQENNSDHTLLCCLAGVYRPAGGSCRPEVRFCETSDPGCSRTETTGRSAWTSPCCRTGAGEWCSCRTYWVKILYLMQERRYLVHLLHLRNVWCLKRLVHSYKSRKILIRTDCNQLIRNFISTCTIIL